MKIWLLLCPEQNAVAKPLFYHVLNLLHMIGSMDYVASFTGKLDKPLTRRHQLYYCEVFAYSWAMRTAPIPMLYPMWVLRISIWNIYPRYRGFLHTTYYTLFFKLKNDVIGTIILLTISPFGHIVTSPSLS